MTVPALKIENLSVSYGQGSQRQVVLRDIDLVIEPGQSYGLVGESGSGKSTLGLAAMRYLSGSGSVVAGRIELAGVNLLDLGEDELREVWRRRIKLVPQDPVSSLNPRLTVSTQIAEGLDLPGRRRLSRVHELLGSVGLADPQRVANSYPHQLSGGQQQRVMIAMALSGEPELLILDEPTTNLDVTTEATILDLVKDLTRERETAVLYVSHSLGVVARVCDRVAVLYAGELVEDAAVTDLYRDPLHPYTRGLLDSVPLLGQDKRRQRLLPIAGQIPQPNSLPSGCVFAPRCPVATDFTRENRPELQPVHSGAVDSGAVGSYPGDSTAVESAPVGSAAVESTAVESTRWVRCHRWREIADGTVDPRQTGNGIAPAGPAEAIASGDPAGTIASGGPAEPVASGDRAEPAGEDQEAELVLQVEGLEKHFPIRRGAREVLAGRSPTVVRAVEGVDLSIPRKRTLGLVGESGSGKSTIARCIIGLVTPSNGSVQLLDIPLERSLSRRDDEVLRRLQMVFQNADEALNPYLTVGQTLRPPLRRLAGAAPAELDKRIADLLAAVKLSPDYVSRFPSELSGGEKQRVAIARAFASEPDLLIFDESVSGLDVSVQAAILNLLGQLQLEQRSAYLFISHDLAVVSYLADEIAVVYLGRLVETGPSRAVLEPPYHPYTEALLSAIPLLDPLAKQERIRLRGEPASATDAAGGCPFHTRCPRFLGDICVDQEPTWQEDESGKRIYCHIPLAELKATQKRTVVLERDVSGAR